jgi:phage/plasmid-associated DNA primase
MKAELSGLLNWVLAMTNEELNAVIGSINGNLTKAQKEHFCETNKLAAWLNDNTVIDPQSIIHIGASTAKIKESFAIRQECNAKLYPNYELWCAENGVSPLAVQRFSTNLLDVCEHVKIDIKKLNRSNSGARVQGLAIRTTSAAHLMKPTPITGAFLNSDEACRSCDEGTSPESRASADGADSDDKNLSVDMEVF